MTALVADTRRIGERTMAMLEKYNSREWLRTEYRINKKGAECFRTEDWEEASSKLAELQSKRPGVYTMQRRHRRENKYGQPTCPGAHDGWGGWG